MAREVGLGKSEPGMSSRTRRAGLGESAKSGLADRDEAREVGALGNNAMAGGVEAKGRWKPERLRRLGQVGWSREAWG